MPGSVSRFHGSFCAFWRRKLFLSAGGNLMSYRTFQFTSQIQQRAMASSVGGEAQTETRPSLAWESMEETRRPSVGASRVDEYTLPAGIASMEHWLDLNA
jgi:hypothetical protein